MKTSFNLIHDKWIPCIDRNGQAMTLSLRQTLQQAHDLREATGTTPLEKAALLRLMLAVLQRVFPFTSTEGWSLLWSAGRWDANRLDAYFTRWMERFELFDEERPFYQAPDGRVKPKSIINLVPHMASGNNATLFDHHTEDVGVTFSPPQAARTLVASQSFSLAGLSGLPEKFTDSPWGRGSIFFLEGDSLFETLALNLMPYTHDLPIPNQDNDMPAWESDDPYEPRSIPRGYLDYLTWQSRRIMLIKEDDPLGIQVSQITIAPGLRLDPSIRDPMKHYKIDAKLGPRPLRFTEERSLWRDSASLLHLNHSNGKELPPLNFEFISQVVYDGYIEKTRVYRCMSLGMANNQARVDFYREEHLPLPLSYLSNPVHVSRLSQALEMSQKAGSQLWGALQSLATFFLSTEADQKEGRKPDPDDVNRLVNHWGAERVYWSRIEQPFYEVIQSLPLDHEKALASWQDVLKRSARDAFGIAETLAGNIPRADKAIVQARGQLEAGLAKVFPKNTN